MTVPALRAALLGVLLAIGLALPGCRKRRRPPKPPKKPTRASTTKLPSFDLWYLVRARDAVVGTRHVSLGPTTPRGAGATGGAHGSLVLRIEQRPLTGVSVPWAKRHLDLEEICDDTGGLREMTTRYRSERGTLSRHYRVQGQTLVITDRRGPVSAGTAGRPGTPARTVRLSAGPALVGHCALYAAMLRRESGRRVRVIDPLRGSVVEADITRERPVGKDMRLRYRYVEVGRPDIARLFYPDAEGYVRRVEIQGYSIRYAHTLTTKVEAQRRLGAKKRPPDLLRGLALHAGPRLPDPLQTQRIRYALTFRQPPPRTRRERMGGQLQQILSPPGGNPVVVEVRRAATLPPETLRQAYTPPAWAAPPSRDRPHLAPLPLASITPQALDVHVRAQVQGATSQLAVCVALTAWAAGPILRGRDRARGLVAALRRAGIPARLAYGFLYVGGAAVQHTWVEARIGTKAAHAWLPLDAGVRGAGPPTHLRLTHSAPHNLDLYAPWRELAPALRGLQIRIVAATLESGLAFSPGGPGIATARGTTLVNRVWNFEVKRPASGRFVLPGGADDFELAVVDGKAGLRATLRLFAANADGLRRRLFTGQGYRPRQIGGRSYLVRASKTRRDYVQMVCRPEPYRARLVRWTVHLHSAKAADLAAFEATVLGSLRFLAAEAGTADCNPAARPAPTKTPDAGVAPPATVDAGVTRATTPDAGVRPTAAPDAGPAPRPR